MTRTYSDPARNFAERNAVARPEPLGRPSAAPMAVTANRSPLLGYVAPDPGNYPPLTDDADARQLRREERFRDRELADLPDTQPEDLL